MVRTQKMKVDELKHEMILLVIGIGTKAKVEQFSKQVHQLKDITQHNYTMCKYKIN